MYYNISYINRFLIFNDETQSTTGHSSSVEVIEAMQSQSNPGCDEMQKKTGPSILGQTPMLTP